MHKVRAEKDGNVRVKLALDTALDIRKKMVRIGLAASDKDLEYYLKVRADGHEVYYPATAPELNQTVVMIKR